MIRHLDDSILAAPLRPGVDFARFTAEALTNDGLVPEAPGRRWVSDPICPSSSQGGRSIGSLVCCDLV